MKGMRKVWKESASLMLMSKNPNPKSKFNYDLLVMKRSTGSKFMANAIVFPGGVIEKSADSNQNWLDLYSKSGVKDSRLDALRSSLNTSPIYQKTEEEQIERELSLRISAIRETFEEVGILLAKNKADLQKENLYTNALTGFDISFWQKEVQGNPSRFFDMCQTLEVVPDVFSLYGWSNWMTPTTVGKHRFDTVFYVASLTDRPEFRMDEKEAQHVVWATPEDLIASNEAETIWLPPPQSYELAKFRQMHDLEDLTKYAKWRSQFGTTLMFPVMYPVKGRAMHLFPGDDQYPKEPNFYEKHEDLEKFTEKTAEELLAESTNVHRTVHESLSKSVLHMNVPPQNEHLCPLGSTNTFEDLKAKAKL